jgi:hypothetical protein
MAARCFFNKNPADKANGGESVIFVKKKTFPVICNGKKPWLL